MAQQQSSRLNRLLTLLDTGSTQVTRFTAAKQIGEIAKSHPQDLHSLLSKVAPYLRSKRWDTRVAAAHAIGAIAQSAKHPSLTDLHSCLEIKMSESGVFGSVHDILGISSSKIAASTSFKSFDLNKVLEFGALLASGGQEYDIATDNSKNPKERLARQKQNLQRRLGLDVCEQFLDVNDMIRDEDLLVQNINYSGSYTAAQYFPAESMRNIKHFVSDMVPSVKSRRPSARELNLLKRKAKTNSKEQSKGFLKDENADGPQIQEQDLMPTKGNYLNVLNSTKQLKDTSFDDETLDIDGDGGWAFQSFIEQLLLDMFDSAWEVRHGSIMALREIITHQGACAGVLMPDLSDAGALDSDSKEECQDENTNGKRKIDLNMQLWSDELETKLKRPKLEYASEPMDTGTTSSSKVTLHADHVKVEETGSDYHCAQTNGELSIGSVKGEVESESQVDIVREPQNGLPEANVCIELKDSMEKENIPENPPVNDELMGLVKFARHSWFRNCEFLRDCAVRFLCILSLDRFGDYVSDQVVAPVRETCAQALGALFKYMHPALISETLSILLEMQRRPEWEIRHGSLLGIKYLVAVRQDMLELLLGHILPSCKCGLEDPDDDVRAVAADALIPAAASIFSQKNEILHSIVMLLWDILLDLDDLSPSTSSVMNLLAEIYSQEKILPTTQRTDNSCENEGFDLNKTGHVDDQQGGLNSFQTHHMLSTLAPRLWPFMRHNITSVRYSAIRTLERLLEAGYKRKISESSSSFWPSSLLGDTLRIVYQNLLLDSNERILQCSERVWKLLLQCPLEELVVAVEPHFSSWMDLATTPYGSPLDAKKMFWPAALPRKSHFKAAAKMRAVRLENDLGQNMILQAAQGTASHENGDGSSGPTKIVVGDDVDISVTYTRVATATALGILASNLYQISFRYIIDPLWMALRSCSGVQRQVASLVLIAWFKELKLKDISLSVGTISEILSDFRSWLLELLACTNPAFPNKDSVLPYAELSRTYGKMRNEASQLRCAADASGMFHEGFSFSQMDMEKLTADDAIVFASKLPLLPKINGGQDSFEHNLVDDLESVKQRLLTTSGYLKCVQGNLHITVCALEAAALVWMSDLPSKLNPIILPLMASVKKEQEEMLQSKAAEALAELISSCIPRKPGPNDKLIKNLCSLTCMDPSETPQAAALSSTDTIEEHELLSFGSNSSRQKSKLHMLASGEDRARVEGFISRRGAELALKYLCQKLGGSLFNSLPKLWDCLVEVFKPGNPEALTAQEDLFSSSIDCVKDPQLLINNIQVVRSLAPLLDEALRPKLLVLLPCIFRCVRHSHIAVRLAASRCIVTMAKSMAGDVMIPVIENVVPMLGDMMSILSRQGAGMLVSLLVQGLGMELVPYAPLLVVPLLRCMGDCDPSVRQSVTHSFASLVPLLPLARNVSLPASLSERLSRTKEDTQFLEQLVDNSHIDDYKLATELKVTLRRYQQEGINWLAFLKRFNLHGILCDDMGLGKTLQASAIVASAVAEDSAAENIGNLPPSLIICPSTLVGHWEYEIEKFIDTSLLSTLQYVGSAQDRCSLRPLFSKYSVIVTSYDVIRKDIDHLRELFWNYCILDEGHIIKNAKSKVTGAVKQLKAKHRLILSGTPIQNNVLDLWSLFDFLMPGFLGTERQFQATYGKPLLAARDPKCSSKDAEAGALAMEALHKQVMPFLLRRTKEEVLSDLPEKIVQDRYCNLSPVQLKLYEQFSVSRAKQEISSMVKLNDLGAKEEKASPKASSHVFQALQYLLKLCSHPLLVIGDKVPESLTPLMSELFPGTENVISELHDLRHSPKLIALREILEECGIGAAASSSEGIIGLGHHRVLIFAQHKAFLDVIERDLFHVHMKNLTYLRLDGSVPPEKRFEIVKTFNSDPTIDALLLTTHVGGLGLNLTSADTLVFTEHDWNPMRDHQAMDRAHRLGQRKVVNVHRLIMRGTLEEKVMSLQRFKVSVANAVINADNSSMRTMNTDQLLDLFTPAEKQKGSGATSSSSLNFDGETKLPGSNKGLKAILGGLEELWDHSQYTEEYDLRQFLTKLDG